MDELERLRAKRLSLLASYEKCEKSNAELDARTDTTLSHMQDIIDEDHRVIDVAHNAEQILNNLDEEFEKRTSLNKLDIKIMFLATALQCARWYIVSNNMFRFASAAQGDAMMGKLVPETWQDILCKSVPYDAVKSNVTDTGISGYTHRYRTLGHDPIMGWIFGPVNILTNSLTKSDFSSYRVNINTMTIRSHANTHTLFKQSVESVQGDKLKLPAAVARQAFHFGSDYFTKQGLPIPFLGTADNDVARFLMTKCNVDMWSITRGVALAVLINVMISSIHQMFYDPATSGSKKLYEAKTKKIIAYSGVMSSVGNIAYVTVSKDFKRLDFGGFLVSLWNLFHMRKFIREVKREFIFGSFDEKIRGVPFSWEQPDQLEDESCRF